MDIQASGDTGVILGNEEADRLSKESANGASSSQTAVTPFIIITWHYRLT